MQWSGVKLQSLARLTGSLICSSAFPASKPLLAPSAAQVPCGTRFVPCPSQRHLGAYQPLTSQASDLGNQIASAILATSEKIGRLEAEMVRAKPKKRALMMREKDELRQMQRLFREIVRERMAFSQQQRPEPLTLGKLLTQHMAAPARYDEANAKLPYSSMCTDATAAARVPASVCRWSSFAEDADAWAAALARLYANEVVLGTLDPPTKNVVVLDETTLYVHLQMLLLHPAALIFGFGAPGLQPFTYARRPVNGGVPAFAFLMEGKVRLVMEVKLKTALNSAAGELYNLVQPSDLGQGGGSSTARSVRQVYNYLELNDLPYGILATDIEFWFLWREVTNNRSVLHISDVHKFDQADPTVLASICYLLHLADQEHRQAALAGVQQATAIGMLHQLAARIASPFLRLLGQALSHQPRDLRCGCPLLEEALAAGHVLAQAAETFCTHPTPQPRLVQNAALAGRRHLRTGPRCHAPGRAGGAQG